MSLAVVGVKFPNADKARSNRRFEIELCAPGEAVELRPEPNNKFDPYAVAVFSARGMQLGYLAAERAPRIGAMIRQGREVRAVFQASAPLGAWIRAAFDGDVPVLPKAPVPVDAEPEFYPDEEWDEFS